MRWDLTSPALRWCEVGGPMWMSLLIVTSFAYGQRPAVFDLVKVTAEDPIGFTRVSGVRELRDGRLIVVDVNDRSVHLLESSLAARRPVGRQGAGPGEYRQPSTIVALEGDSSGVFDLALGRMLVIMPDGRAKGVISLIAPASASGRPRTWASTADQRGYLYAISLPLVASAAEKVTVNSAVAAIERWHGGSSVLDTAGFVPASMPISRSSDEALATLAIELNPFGSGVQWAVAPDGTLAIAHPHPYRVEFLAPDGTRADSDSIAYRPIEVSEANKDQWRNEMRRPRVMTLFRPGQQGSATVLMETPPVEPRNWPRLMPPFARRAIRFSPNGDFWVERTAEAGARSTFDVFGPGANLVRRATIPTGTRLVGFGNGCVYVVRKDDVDLEHIQRIHIEW